MLTGKDILTAAQFTRDELELVLRTAARFEGSLRKGETLSLMVDKILCTLFYEPSTRTRLSFETAMLRLGGSVISVAEAKTSSAAKGESLTDAVRTIEGYADLIVLRHPEKGAAALAAEAASIPVLNAGDGTGEHPTQALLDLYTIRKEKGRLDDLTVALVGDLKHGRTVHSLVRLLALYGNRLVFCAPPTLEMPAEIASGLQAKGTSIEETADLEAAAARADVLYVTRIQRERFADPAAYERLKGSYVVDLNLVRKAKPGLVIMHPLPRVDEIATEVDAYEGAAYFRQAANGLPTRMALLALVAGRA